MICICLRSGFLDFGEGFYVYLLISLVFIELYSLKKLILCFRTNQGNKNPLVHILQLQSSWYFSLLSIFLDFGEGLICINIYWTLDFTCLDKVLFQNVAHIFYKYCNFTSVHSPSIHLFVCPSCRRL